MSLNDIELTGSLLTRLYEKVLVESSFVQSPANIQTGTGSPSPDQPEGGIRFLGRNQKRYCFVVDYQDESFVPDEVMDTLTKILQACKLSMDDIALVNVATPGVSIESLRANLSPEKMVLLGVQPAVIRLPIQFPPYHPQAYAGCLFLLSDPLHVMDNSETGRKLKTSLWNCLKEMFVA